MNRSNVQSNPEGISGEVIRVLHVGHATGWRGGENQTRLLIQNMNSSNALVSHYLAYPRGAVIFDRLKNDVRGVVKLSSGNPFSIRNVWLIIRHCREHQIDILHAHSGNAHSLAYLARLFLPNVKLIVHRRVDNPIKTKFFTRKKFLSSNVDAFISVSSAIAKICKAYGVALSKVHLIYDAIDQKPYRDLKKNECKRSLVNQFGWDENALLIGFISAIDKQKNPELFIQVLRVLKSRGLMFNCIIAGTGKLEQKVKHLIDESDLSDQCKMVGFITDTAPLFSALDIFVLPSINEGLGTVNLEAMSAQAVVVASDVGGISEIVRNKETGLLAQSGNAEDFANKIIEVANDESLRQDLIKNAETNLNEKFNLDVMVESTHRLYNCLL